MDIWWARVKTNANQPFTVGVYGASLVKYSQVIPYSYYAAVTVTLVVGPTTRGLCQLESHFRVYTNPAKSKTARFASRHG